MRVLARGWLTHIRYLMSSGFFLLTSAVQPLVFATIASFLFRAGGRPGSPLPGSLMPGSPMSGSPMSGSLLYAAIGAGMLSLWSTTLIGSGQALTLLRTAGMLELLVAAPTPFALVLAPITLATATVGLYALVATLAWGWLLFDVPLHVAHPAMLALAIPVTVFGLGMLGMVFASVFVRFRYANALTNLLDYPIWLASGMLIPVGLLPSWVRPLSWLLPPTWGAQAIRESIAGGRPLTAIAAGLALGLGYLGLGVLTVRRFELLARRRASLALT